MDPFELFGGSGSASHLGDLGLPMPTPNDSAVNQPHMQQLLSNHPSIFTPSGAPGGTLSESDTNLLTALFAPFQADRSNAAMMVNQHQPQQSTDFMQQNQQQHDPSHNQFGMQFPSALQTPGVHQQQSMNPNALFADLYASPYARPSSSITNAGGAGLQPDGLPPAISADGMFQQYTNLQRGSSGLSGLSIPASNPAAGRPQQPQQAVNFSVAAAQASGPSASGKASASTGPAPMVTSTPAPAAPAARSNKKGTAVKETASKGKASNASNKKIKTGPMSEEEMKERRKKHNEVEIRRRQRIKNSFSELGAIIGCDSSQKRIILSSAIDAIKDYEDKIKSLQTSIDNLSVPDDTETKAVAAPAPTDVANVDPNSTSVDHGSIFHSSGVPLAIASFDGRVLDCNPAFARLFGFTREAMVEGQSTTLFSLTAPESLPAAFTTVGSLMGGQPSVQNNIQIIGPEGVMRSVRLTAWSVRENQKPKYFMCMVIPLSTDGAVLPPNASAQLANEPKHLIMDQPFNRPAT